MLVTSKKSRRGVMQSQKKTTMQMMMMMMYPPPHLLNVPVLVHGVGPDEVWQPLGGVGGHLVPAVAVVHGEEAAAVPVVQDGVVSVLDTNGGGGGGKSWQVNSPLLRAHARGSLPPSLTSWLTLHPCMEEAPAENLSSSRSSECFSVSGSDR